jgi:tetratricopeptide (TPR) repeat protein
LKILASFVVLCVALLAVVVWHLRQSAQDSTVATPADASDVSPPAEPVVTRPMNDSRSTNKPESVLRDPERDAPIAASLPASASIPPPIRVAVAGAAASSAPATRVTVPGVPGVRERRAWQRLAELREILLSDPYNEAALEAALDLAREFGWHEAARGALERLVSLRPEKDDLRFELAVQLMQLELWLEAITQLRAIVERDPENGPSAYNLAIAHQSVGHLRDARTTWDRVITLMPENPDAYAHRGEVLLDLESWKAAATDFETALRLEPESIDAALNLSLALSKLGQHVAARDTLLAILERHPRHVPLLNRLAEIAWAAYESAPIANKKAAAETIYYSRRSLAVVPDQPEMESLLDRATEARE